jgi:hypothetical protein
LILISGSPPWTLAQRGVEFNEIGIAVKRFEVRYFPEVNDKLLNNAGETIARALSDKFSREIRVEGETTGATGVMSFAIAATCTLANDISDFGDGSGRVLLDDATVTQERAGWRSVSLKLSSHPQMP